MTTKKTKPKQGGKLTPKQVKGAQSLYRKGWTLDQLQNAMKKAGVGARRANISKWMQAKGKGKRSVYAGRVRSLKVAMPHLTHKEAMREISLSPAYAKRRTGKEKGYLGGAKRSERMAELRKTFAGQDLDDLETRNKAYDQMIDEGAVFGDTPH